MKGHVRKEQQYTDNSNVLVNNTHCKCIALLVSNDLHFRSIAMFIPEG